MTTARNFLLLLILNGAGDRKVNVDIALHFWYSVSFPRDYHSRLPWLSNPSGQSIDAQAIDLMMTTGTRLRGDIGPEATRQWLRYIIPTVPGTPNKAQEAFKQTM